MLTEYIHAAMERATYEILEDGTYCGEIPGFLGVFANDQTLAGCQRQLQEVLEGWMILGIKMGHRLPTVGGISLNLQPSRALEKAA